MSGLVIENIDLKFTDEYLFHQLNLEVKPGQSACIHTGVLDGGTSLLKAAAGLLRPNSGTIKIDDKDVSSMSDTEKFNHVSLSFETGGLLGIFTNYNNIVFPLLYHKALRPEKIADKIIPLAEQLGVTNILKREPHQLNDVQTRLINLLRSLVFAPKVLLLDEIQSGMDNRTREKVLNVILTEQAKVGFCIVMTVTAGDDTSFANQVYAIEKRRLTRRAS